MNYNLFDKALIFSALAHDGQYRKGTVVPYITHPVTVAMTLLSMDCSDDVVMAALLHDVIEDTAFSFEEIEHEFGTKVAQTVEAVSEADKDAPWEERKEHTLQKLRLAPISVKLVACADKLHNIHSIARDYQEVGDQVWDRFGRGREKVAWYYKGLAESLPYGIKELDRYPIFGEFVRRVEQVFGSTEDR